MPPSPPSWLSPFSQSVQRAVAAWLASPGAPGALPLACFDADGTLWSEDLGEAFFRWLAAGSHLPALAGRPPQSVWEEYEERVRADRTAGYGWAVQCMAGLQESQVRAWARQLAFAWPNGRPAMAGLLAGLRQSGAAVWIVSASNAWIVEAAAPRFGVDPGNVLGLRVEVEGGRLTDRLVQPLSCGPGKVAAISAALGRAPGLAVGDSLGDLEMLEAAAQPIGIGRHDQPGADLLAAAKQRGWPVHLF
jgi:HAD superfamily phosphoserine phosphatase-like hydrolase